MSDEQIIDILIRIEKELTIISNSLRLLIDEKIRNILEEELDTNEKRQVYELTDGRMSRRNISKITGISDDTIQGWWDRWVSKGILRKDLKTGRPYKLFSLEEFGINKTRELKKRQQQNEEKVE